MFDDRVVIGDEQFYPALVYNAHALRWHAHWSAN
jgi:hypothetical protein